MHSTRPTARWGMATLAVLATSALLLSGCSSTPAEEDGPVTIEYFNFTAGADHADKLQAIVDAFEEENPNITIEVSNASFDDYFTQLQTRIAGNTAPDTFELNYENFVSFAASGALLDLEAAGSSIDAEKFFPRAFDAFNYDGIQYGLPESFSDVVLYYNKDLFDAAGVEYPNESWTWVEEAAAAEKLTDLANGVYGEYQPVQFFEFFKTLAQSGGEFFNDDLTEATFNSDAGVQAGEWLVNKVGDTMPTVAQMGGKGDDLLFKEGKIAMWHTGIWMFNALATEPANWDIAVEPGNTTRASHFFANAAVASATTDSPTAAGKWLQFLAGSDETVKQRLEGEWELPAVFDDSLLAPYLAKSPPESRHVVFDALEAVVVPPVIERQQELQDIVTLALEKAVQGEMTVKEALDDAVNQVNALL